MATVVRRGTKAAEVLIREMNYRHPNGTTLYEVYGKCSEKKRSSWQQICSDCTYLRGEKLHITGASCYNYSAIYAYPIFDYRTGDAIEMTIRKVTKGGTYELTLPIDEYMEVIK